MAFFGACYLGFAPTRRPLLFARAAVTRIAHVDGTRKYLRSKADPEVGERAACLLLILRRLIERFETQKEIVAWLKQPQKCLGCKSPRQLLLSGKLADMRTVCNLLRHTNA